MILDYAKKCEKRMLFTSLAVMVLGIVLLIAPTGSLNFITSLIALALTITGICFIVDYIKKNKEEKMISISLIVGIIFIAFGAFLFVNMDSLVKFITTLIGIVIVIKSLFKLQFAFNIKNVTTTWVYNLGFGLTSLAIGIILIFNPFESATLFLQIIGVLLIISSIAEIVENVKVMQALDDVKELPFVEKKKEESIKEEKTSKKERKKGKKDKDLDQ